MNGPDKYCTISPWTTDCVQCARKSFLREDRRWCPCGTPDGLHNSRRNFWIFWGVMVGFTSRCVARIFVHRDGYRAVWWMLSDRHRILEDVKLEWSSVSVKDGTLWSLHKVLHCVWPRIFIVSTEPKTTPQMIWITKPSPKQLKVFSYKTDLLLDYSKNVWTCNKQFWQS